LAGQGTQVTEDPQAAWVKELYHDLLHRTPGAAEVDSWVAALHNGLSHAAVVQGFLGSTEYSQDVVTGYYQKYLHRAPDGGGLAYFTRPFQTGASQSSVQAAILDSPEYWQQHGGTASGFVTALYSDVMGRTPGGQDTDYWAGVVQSRGQAAVVNGFLSSPE